jgi:hypothetical protein
MHELLDHLRRLEEKLFDPAVRSSRQALEELLAPDFQEIGSSGRLFRFEDIVMALSTEEPVMSRTLHNLRIVMLATTVALITYGSTRKTTDGVETKSLRSSVWRQENDGQWRMVFHQGTLAP